MAGRMPAGLRVPLGARLREIPKPLVVVLGGALVLRLAWVLYAEREPSNFGDPFIYLALARGVAQGAGYHLFFSHSPTAFHPVGYPGWLAGIVWFAKGIGLQDHEPLVIGLVQALLGTASVALVYAIARRLFDSRVALLAAAITAAFPSLVVYTGLEYSETLYTFGVLLAVWLLVRAEWKPVPATRAVVGFGVVVGFTTLVRPFALLILVPLAVAAARTGVGAREIARALAIVAGITALMLVPWTIRNESAFHAFVPVSTNLGDTLCLDNSPGAYGGFRELPPECEIPVRDGYDEPARNSHNLRYAVKWAVHHPGTEATLVFRRIYYGYRNDHDGVSDLAGASGKFPPQSVRTPLDWVSDVYYWLVVAIALPGLLAFGRDPRRLFVLLVGASIAIVPVLLYGLTRFHIPLLPFLAIAAAAAIDGRLRRNAGTA
jgi:4-amino-4-deoxy-L-arabinose transferase-like glycosyltransferase